MSAKIRITIAVLLLFIPVVLGIVHRIYYHGKDSFIFIWKKSKHDPKDEYGENNDSIPRHGMMKAPIEEVESSESTSKNIKDAPPRFVGGNEALKRYIQSETIYPENQTAQGSVILKMRLDERGFTTDITVTKSMGSVFDKEAIRVVENMPSWEPQIKDYKPVKSDFIYVEVPFHRPNIKR